MVTCSAFRASLQLYYTNSCVKILREDLEYLSLWCVRSQLQQYSAKSLKYSTASVPHA